MKRIFIFTNMLKYFIFYLLLTFHLILLIILIKTLQLNKFLFFLNFTLLNQQS